MQFHTTPRRNGVKMVYGKSDCRRENDTLLPPPKNRMKALMEHTAIGMTVQRICRWLFHFSVAFRGEYGEKYRLCAAWVPCLYCHPTLL